MSNLKWIELIIKVARGAWSLLREIFLDEDISTADKQKKMALLLSVVTFVIVISTVDLSLFIDRFTRREQSSEVAPPPNKTYDEQLLSGILQDRIERQLEEMYELEDELEQTKNELERSKATNEQLRSKIDNLKQRIDQIKDDYEKNRGSRDLIERLENLN